MFPLWHVHPLPLNNSLLQPFYHEYIKIQFHANKCGLYRILKAKMNRILENLIYH